MTNRTYDILAYIQRIFLPALGVLIGALGEIWKWDLPTAAIVATISAVDYFLGRVLKISSDHYFESLEELSSLDVPEEPEEANEEGIG